MFRTVRNVIIQETIGGQKCPSEDVNEGYHRVQSPLEDEQGTADVFETREVIVHATQSADGTNERGHQER